MAQESVQGTGQANVQTTVKITRPFRETEHGGVDITYIMTPDGRFVKPTRSERSNSGRHGWDEWVLSPGRYVVISVHRPNLRNGWKPYSVTIQCIVNEGRLNIVRESKIQVVTYNRDTLVEWARGICP